MNADVRVAFSVYKICSPTQEAADAADFQDSTVLQCLIAYNASTYGLLGSPNLPQTAATLKTIEPRYERVCMGRLCFKTVKKHVLLINA